MNTHMAHPKPRPGQPRTAYYFLICGTQKLGKGVDGARGGWENGGPTHSIGQNSIFTWLPLNLLPAW